MKTLRFTLIAAFAASLLLSPSYARADQQFNVPTTQGSYDYQFSSDGASYGVISDALYIGLEPTGFMDTTFHNYFVFDLTQVPIGDTITSATFTITGMSPQFGPGTIDLLSTNLSPSLVLSASTQDDLQSVFDGLVSGASLSSNTIITPNQNYFNEYDATVTANADFLSLLNANIGGTVVIGNNGGNDGLYFGGSAALDIAAVPEPSTLALVGAILSAAVVGRARNSRGRWA